MCAENYRFSQTESFILPACGVFLAESVIFFWKMQFLKAFDVRFQMGTFDTHRLALCCVFTELWDDRGFLIAARDPVRTEREATSKCKNCLFLNVEVLLYTDNNLRQTFLDPFSN